MPLPESHTEIHLKSRPEGMPALENFEVAQAALPTISAGEILVKNEWLTVDPYMRGRMKDTKSYVPPFQAGQAHGGWMRRQGRRLEEQHFRRGRLCPR